MPLTPAQRHTPFARFPLHAILLVALAALVVLPQPVSGQFDSDDSDNLGPALAVYGVSIIAAYLLFNPPEPVFSVSGEELMQANGQSRLSNFSGPVAVRQRGFAKWAVMDGSRVGNADVSGATIIVDRQGEQHSYEADRTRDVTDLGSAAARAKELRTSLGIFAIGSGATIALLADGQGEGSSRTLMQLSGALAAAGGVYFLLAPSPTERLAQEYESTGRLSVLPSLTWPEGRPALGVTARLTW